MKAPKVRKCHGEGWSQGARTSSGRKKEPEIENHFLPGQGTSVVILPPTKIPARGAPMKTGERVGDKT